MSEEEINIELEEKIEEENLQEKVEILQCRVGGEKSE